MHQNADSLSRQEIHGRQLRNSTNITHSQIPSKPHTNYIDQLNYSYRLVPLVALTLPLAHLWCGIIVLLNSLPLFFLLVYNNNDSDTMKKKKCKCATNACATSRVSQNIPEVKWEQGTYTIYKSSLQDQP